jgi:HPt (histidine-containing phosphotransfer) domain-containing protein
MARESQIEMKDLIQLYLDSQDEFLLICENAPKEERWMEIGKAVHKFRPSLQMVSQEALENNLHILEDYCCKGGGHEDIPGLIQQAIYMCVQIKRELDEELTRISEL